MIIEIHEGQIIDMITTAQMIRWLIRHKDEIARIAVEVEGLLDSLSCPRCSPPAPPTKADEMGMKCAAKIILADHSRRVIVPTRDAWIGIGLLDRDDGR